MKYEQECDADDSTFHGAVHGIQVDGHPAQQVVLPARQRRVAEVAPHVVPFAFGNLESRVAMVAVVALQRHGVLSVSSEVAQPQHAEKQGGKHENGDLVYSHIARFLMAYGASSGHQMFVFACEMADIPIMRQK